MSKETYVKVEGYSSLVRETKTGAIINTNKSAYEKSGATLTRSTETEG